MLICVDMQTGWLTIQPSIKRKNDSQRRGQHCPKYNSTHWEWQKLSKCDNIQMRKNGSYGTRIRDLEERIMSSARHGQTIGENFPYFQDTYRLANGWLAFCRLTKLAGTNSTCLCSRSSSASFTNCGRNRSRPFCSRPYQTHNSEDTWGICRHSLWATCSTHICR